MYIQILYVAIGGAVGAVSRFLISLLLLRHCSESIYLPTLAVNVLGSLTLGLLAGFFAHSISPSVSYLRPLLIIGFCGSFTTFSTFSLENYSLISSGRLLVALLYTLASVVGCIGAVWIGWRLSR